MGKFSLPNHPWSCVICLDAARRDFSAVIYPNNMTFEETIDLVNEGILEMHVDQGLAIMAVRSGVPLSSAGKLANLIMVVSPIIGLILAFLVAWWWALIGLDLPP